jgi:hypothetical protein
MMLRVRSACACLSFDRHVHAHLRYSLPSSPGRSRMRTPCSSHARSPLGARSRGRSLAHLPVVELAESPAPHTSRCSGRWCRRRSSSLSRTRETAMIRFLFRCAASERLRGLSTVGRLAAYARGRSRLPRQSLTASRESSTRFEVTGALETSFDAPIPPAPSLASTLGAARDPPHLAMQLIVHLPARLHGVRGRARFSSHLSMRNHRSRHGTRRRSWSCHVRLGARSHAPASIASRRSSLRARVDCVSTVGRRARSRSRPYDALAHLAMLEVAFDPRPSQAPKPTSSTFRQPMLSLGPRTIRSPLSRSFTFRCPSESALRSRLLSPLRDRLSRGDGALAVASLSRVATAIARARSAGASDHLSALGGDSRPTSGVPSSRLLFRGGEDRVPFPQPLPRLRNVVAPSGLASSCSLTLADARARLGSPRRHAPARDHLAVIASGRLRAHLASHARLRTAHLADVRHESVVLACATIGILASLPNTFRRSDRSRVRVGSTPAVIAYFARSLGARGRSKELAPPRRPRGLGLARARAPLGARTRSRPRRPRRSPPRLSAVRCSAFAAIRARSTSLHLAGGSSPFTSASPRGVPTLRARGMVHLTVGACSRGSRLCSPPRVPRRDHLAMIPFVPALRAAHVRLRLSTPALMRLAGCPTPLASSRRSRRARLLGARGITTSSLDESRSASTYDGHRRCAHPRTSETESVLRRFAFVRADGRRQRVLLSHDAAPRSRSRRRSRAHLSALPSSIAAMPIAAPRPCSASKIERTFRCSRSRPRRSVHRPAFTKSLSLLRSRARRSSVRPRAHVRLATSMLAHAGCSWSDALAPVDAHHLRVHALSPHLAMRFGRALTTLRGSRMEAAFATAIRPHT